MSDKIFSITEQELLIKIFDNVNELQKNIVEYDNLITDRIVNLNNYELLLKTINISEITNKYLWNLILSYSGNHLNELKKLMKNNL